MSEALANLTIGAVASETDVSVAVLRAWEARYGFPAPDRVASGHRRYTTRHVEQIHQVQRDRGAGISLATAIARARTGDGRAESSIFAGLRRRWPDLPVHVLSKRTLLALSRSIEDECCARAERPALIGSFQRERYYRQTEARWRELARTASSTIVFADFPSTRQRRSGLREISVPHDAPLLREWAVVCDAPDLSACVAAVERPRLGNDDDRRFETLWSVDPAVVRDATDIAAGIAGGGEGVRGEPGPGNARPTTDPAGIARSATVITNRVIAYLDN